MFKNYWITAVRNLVRNKVYAIVNIGGLAIGLGTFLLIALFVGSELGFDKGWKDIDRLYRLEATISRPGQPVQITSLSSGALKPMLDKDFSDELVAASRVLSRRSNVTYEGVTTRQPIAFVDAEFSDIFNVEMQEGRLEDALKDNKSIAVSARQAKRMFGDETAIGKVITFVLGGMGSFDFKVAAVMKDLPEETHLTLDYLALLDPPSYADQPWVLENWYSHNVFLYVKLAEGTSEASFSASLPAFLDRNFNPATTAGMNFDASVKASDLRQITMMPVQDIYLYSNVRPQMKSGGDHQQIKILIAIAAAILLIAIVNFTNLTNARALRRLKEIAIRKVTGATKRQLMLQFLGEAVVVAFLGLLFALPIVELTVVPFGELIGKEIDVMALYQGSSPLMVFGIVLFTGCMGGIYPALVLSSSNPAAILGGSKGGPVAGRMVRAVLVVLQFSVSIALTVMTIVVLAQTKYVQERDIGIDAEDRYIMIGLHTEQGRAVGDTVVSRIQALPGVVAVGSSNRMIPIFGGHNPTADFKTDSGASQVVVEQIVGSYNLLKVLDAELVAGRFFSEDFRSDLSVKDDAGNISRGVIVTDYTVRAMGFSTNDAALGHSMTIPQDNGTLETLTIVGVVKDMNLRSARADRENLVFKLSDEGPEVLNVHLSAMGQTETLAEIEKIWNEHLPGQPLNAGMMDEQFRGFYANEDQQALVFGYSALLSILVATVGLFGLAALTAESKTREIGVRKVHGATIWALVRLMVWQFSKPVFYANLIGWPIAWFAMAEWLDGFVFRINLSPEPFLLAGIVAVFVAWLTVGFHAFTVARTNPVNALRYE